MAVRDKSSCHSPSYFAVKETFSLRWNIPETEVGPGPHPPESIAVFHDTMLLFFQSVGNFYLPLTNP